MRKHYWIAAAILAVVSCQDSAGPSVRRGMVFISGNNVTDTVGATLTPSLIVEVHDSTGALAPKETIVRFTGVPLQSGFVEALVQSLTSAFFQVFTTGTTDEGGRTGVQVQLGTKAGVARVAVTVPTLGLYDTARFTILPGNATRVAILPIDTALLVGGTYTLRGGTADRFGNLRTEPVTWSASGPGITVTTAGVVTVSTIGRYTITATAGGSTANAFVSVVPPLTMTAWRLDYPTSSIVTMNLDGSNLRTLATVMDGGIGAHPAWVPGSSKVVYTTIEGDYQTLRVVDANGTSSLFMTQPPNTMTHQAEPTHTATGNFMFFSAFDTRCGNAGDYCLFRSGTDGSAPQLLSSAGTSSRQPGPSPDGSRVAFTPDAYSSVIRVLDIGAGTISSWSVSGQQPRWSPDGSKIAYVSGNRIMLVNADGTNSVALTPTSRLYYAVPIDWSPDGKWIVAKSSFGPIDLIDAQTGNALPLPYSASFSAPSIK